MNELPKPAQVRLPAASEIAYGVSKFQVMGGRGINGRGQIVGYGAHLPTGATVGIIAGLFFGTPVSEPASLLALAVPLVIFRRRRRQLSYSQGHWQPTAAARKCNHGAGIE